MNGINLLSIEIVCEQRINTFFHDGIVRWAFSSYGYMLVVCCCCCWRCAMDTNEKSLPNKKNILCENDITLKVGVGRKQTFSLQIIANNAKYPFCWRFFCFFCAVHQPFINSMCLRDVIKWKEQMLVFVAFASFCWQFFFSSFFCFLLVRRLVVCSSVHAIGHCHTIWCHILQKRMKTFSYYIFCLL